MGGDPHHDRRDPDGRRPPRLHRPDRGLPRADLRLRLSWLASTWSSARSPRRSAAPPRPTPRPRRLEPVEQRRLDRLPAAHGRRSRRQPGFTPGNRRGRLAPAVVLAHLHPAGAARCDRAGRREHRPRQGRRRDDRRPTSTRTWAVRSPPTASATVFASAVGGSPTTTYAENIGVMAATRVYSTAAYFVAAVVAILLGLCPKFGAIVNATPGGRARRHHPGALRHDRAAGREDLDREQRRLRRPVNLVPSGRGHHPGHRRRAAPQFTDDFTLAGIALGTIVVVGRLPPGPRRRPARRRRHDDGGRATGAHHRRSASPARAPRRYEPT